MRTKHKAVKSVSIRDRYLCHRKAVKHPLTLAEYTKLSEEFDQLMGEVMSYSVECRLKELSEILGY